VLSELGDETKYSRRKSWAKRTQVWGGGGNRPLEWLAMPDDVRSEGAEFQIKALDIEDEAIKNYQIPSYTNFFQVWNFGSDVFIDMGLVTVESLMNLSPGDVAPVAFHDRFVMNVAQFDTFVKRLNVVHEALQKSGS